MLGGSLDSVGVLSIRVPRANVGVNGSVGSLTWPEDDAGRVKG